MEPQPRVALPVERGLINYTQWIYILQALTVLMGLLTSRSVAVRFAFGLPSLVAVVMNYARRAEARDTWLESHFRWQIRTFWFAFLWACVCGLLIVTVVGALLGLPGLLATGIWITYRVIRGWLALKDRRPMYV